MPDVTISLRPAGPYLVKGPITLLDPEGNAIDVGPGENVALCRCGASESKPFCDKSHKRVNFLGGWPPEV